MTIGNSLPASKELYSLLNTKATSSINQIILQKIDSFKARFKKDSKNLHISFLISPESSVLTDERFLETYTLNLGKLISQTIGEIADFEIVTIGEATPKLKPANSSFFSTQDSYFSQLNRETISVEISTKFSFLDFLVLLENLHPSISKQTFLYGIEIANKSEDQTLRNTGRLYEYLLQNLNLSHFNSGPSNSWSITHKDQLSIFSQKEQEASFTKDDESTEELFVNRDLVIFSCYYNLKLFIPQTINSLEYNKWQFSFIELIGTLTFDMWLTLVEQIPLELDQKIYNESKVTAFELAGLCFVKGHETKDVTPPENLPETDCWFTSDDPDILCSSHGKNCPLAYPPNLSSSGLTLQPRKVPIDLTRLKKDHHSIINNLNTPFDSKRFSIPPSPPISIGNLSNPDRFSTWGPVPQAQNMPIKQPFTDYRIPKELAQFEEAVQMIANYWHSLNPDYADYYYCYLSVAQSVVPPNCFQRRGHLHSDGFQSHWIKAPLFSDFSFIISDTASTEFFLESFNTDHLNPEKDNYYKYFSKHMTVKPKLFRNPYEVVMMDTYTLHKAIKNKSSNPIKRTFLRFMYSVIRWEKAANAHNPMFKYSWRKIKRNILSDLN